MFAKANPDADVDKRSFTLWYYSGTNNVSYTELGYKYEVTDEWQLFQYEATFGNANESIGTSNVPDDYATDIYVWGFSIQYLV